ncbi:hypothetical protein HK105_208477 [Polyrhizophydium stewartii]|uniref:CBS domain-containing protein n=1 Tax=Polyrhizophydium stewartii TaxID=2732419 RepID=A0ABR4MXU9_9FUNG|nr:hypothetical protein HK105_006048 [Polyrhizophydium stewartii]
MKPLTQHTFKNLGLAGKKLPLTTVPPTTPIRVALETLAERSIIHLAVQSHSDAARVYAVVGILDLVAYVCRRAAAETQLDARAPLLDDPVEQVLTLDADDESYTVFERDIGDTLEETLRAFSHGVHRALVTDITKTTPAFLLGQADVLKYILATSGAAAGDAAPAFAVPLSTPLRDALPGRFTAAVSTVPHTATALAALTQLARRGTPAAPVVDAAGRVVAVVSAKDLRRITGNTIASLHDPVTAFLAAHASAGVQPCVVARDAQVSVLDAVRMLVDRRVHHLWIVDADMKPVGVVSHSDIIACVSGNLEKPAGH